MRNVKYWGNKLFQFHSKVLFKGLISKVHLWNMSHVPSVFRVEYVLASSPSPPSLTPPPWKWAGDLLPASAVTIWKQHRCARPCQNGCVIHSHFPVSEYILITKLLSPIVADGLQFSMSYKDTAERPHSSLSYQVSSNCLPISEAGADSYAESLQELGIVRVICWLRVQSSASVLDKK